MTFAHFHRWRWWDIVISAIIVGSPPLLQRIAHGFARVSVFECCLDLLFDYVIPLTFDVTLPIQRIHPPPQAAPQSAEDMELQELEAALRKMRVKNQARRAKYVVVIVWLDRVNRFGPTFQNFYG